MPIDSEIVRFPSPEILVVDDDEGLRLLISDVLQAGGYHITGVESGLAAIEALEETRPDLMLLDLKLKDMPGTQLLSALKKRGGVPPFVVVTGQGDERIAVEMMKIGAIDYVMKETGILELLPEVVKRALRTLDTDRALGAAQEERRRLEKEIIEIGERERQRIGADLHDGLGQQLTAIELMCVGLKGDLSRLNPDFGAQVSEIAGRLRSAIAHTRSLARGLSPLPDEDDALQAGLRDLATQVTSIGHVRCSADNLSAIAPPDRTTAGHLFRIAQEAVNNAVKHSRASKIVIRWKESPTSLRLEVADNGAGLKERDPKGRGIGIMRYRAGLIGASLQLSETRGGGLTVTCEMDRPL